MEQMSEKSTQLDLRPGLLRASVAVAQRQIKTYLRYPGWLLAQLIWPVLIPLNFVFAARALAGADGAGLAAFATLAGTEDYVGFLVIGTTFWMWFNWMLWGLGTSLRNEQLRGTLESSWLAPLPKAFLALGAFLGEGMIGVLVMLIATASASLVFGVRLMGHLGLFAAVVLASTLPIYGFGMVFGSLVLAAKEVNGFVFLARGLITILCGVSFPIAVLPRGIQAVSQWIPMTHSITAVRLIIRGGGMGDIAPHLRFLAGSGVLLILLGLGVFEIVQRRMLAAGTVGRY